jgi:hypothetical protein
LVLALLTTVAAGCGVTPYAEPQTRHASVADGGNFQADAPAGALVDDAGAPQSPDADADTCATTVLARPGTVITRTGAVTGTRAGSTWAFKGIPYVMPPVGALRWKPPAPVACWHDERQATAFWSELSRSVTPTATWSAPKDCLYTQRLDTRRLPPARPSSSSFTVAETRKAARAKRSTTAKRSRTRTHSIVVTFDYRLGALGFFAHPDLDKESATSTSGNYGILDQNRGAPVGAGEHRRIRWLARKRAPLR